MNIYKSVTEEVLVPIHPAGWPFIFLFVLISLLISYFWQPFVLPGTLLSLWCVYFFRNPVRTTPITENLVISPADGRVLSTGIVDVPSDLDLPAGEWRRISIFMNVFDVHVNRAPVSGKVVGQAITRASFSMPASTRRQSKMNARIWCWRRRQGNLSAWCRLPDLWRGASSLKRQLAITCRLASNLESSALAAVSMCGFLRQRRCWC